jgi:hypothetical protein
MRVTLNATTRNLLLTLGAGLLGNLLAYLSALLITVQPQIAFDLSHVATFTVALYLGPYYGLLAGALVAIYPYIEFGVMGIYGPFLGLAIIVGKAMTGFFCGLLASRTRPYLAVAFGYIPEFLFTLVFLKATQLWVAPDALTWEMISSILLKGWIEVLILSFVLETVSRRHIAETSVLLLEIFIVTLLVHKENNEILAALLAIVLVIMILVDLVGQGKKMGKSWIVSKVDE